MWNGTHNLISKNEISNLEEHLADSHSLIPHIQALDSKTIIDIGSGGGFPIIPIAFWAKGQQYKIIATDIIDKKITFLKWCNAKFKLDMDIVKINNNFIYHEPCIITSRAFSSIKNIMLWQQKHAPATRYFLLLKGNNVHHELSEANITNYTLIPNPRGYILSIKP